MKNECLAKAGYYGENKKTIKQHTDDLLKQYKKIKEIYPEILTAEEWDILKDAVIYHDIGKINTKFQNKLYEKLKYTEYLTDKIKGEEIYHNFLSPLFIDTNKYEELYGKENTRILLSAVYYHHDREEREYDFKEVKKDLEEQIKYIDDFYGLELKVADKKITKYILDNNLLSDINLFKSKRYIMIKGLLNKLDYSASIESTEIDVEEDTYINGKSVSDLIKDKFDGKYREVQKYMLENEKNNLVVVSPTGSGKTEAALLWIGDSKAFYTLPLKVSINAMYKRIIKNVGYKKALLLHSDARAYYINQENEEDLNAYDRAVRLASPLIVTTVDQLFKVSSRYKGYEERLATLSYSKVIIDEIQMYSPRIVAYILIGLKMITELGGKFAIITATFPPVLHDLMKSLGIEYKKQEKLFPSHIQNRHFIKVYRDTDIEIEKVKEAGKNKKVLVIVNTVKKAQELYEELKDKNVHLIHGHYLKKDREKLEKNILEFSSNEENGIWISTQIVEASLDIDFDILFTSMTSIDGLLQRMGRVYRKREYTGSEPNVYIYDNKNGIPKIIEPKIYEFTLKEISKEKYQNKILEENEKQEIINKIFDIKLNPELEKSSYLKTIKNEIKDLVNIKPNAITKAEIDNYFRGIQTISLIPDNIYEELNNNGKIEEWETKLKSRISIKEKIRIKEEIAQNTVNVVLRKWTDYDKDELFYKDSNIYRTRYKYEFDKTELNGKGLIMERCKCEGYFDD